MSKYIKLLNEYLNFVKDNKDSFDDSERRLVDLFLKHFDELVESGTAHGKRAKLVNTIIQRNGQAISSELILSPEAVNGRSFSFASIASLTVENFRGFSQKEVIPFDRRYTFIYGPNGSGKSSLCEALEYSMLGYINEAIAKRIETSQYIMNRITGKASLPILEGTSPRGTPIKIAAEHALHHFCFIEKSRIENFARISANTPNEKKHLLASLFGLDEFNDFVSNFTGRIEDYIDVKGMKAEELKKKSEGLSVHKENILQETKKLTAMESEGQQLTAEAALKMQFDALDTHIHGDESNNGRLAEIDESLNMPIGKACVAPTTAALDAAFSETDTIIKTFQNLNEQYLRNKDKFSFRDLYSAAVELEPLSKDKCPVCETPIEASVKHPYQNARERLLELASIAAIEQRRDTTFKELRERLQSLSQLLSEIGLAAKQLSLPLSVPGYTPTVLDTITAHELIIGDYQNIKIQCNTHRAELVSIENAVTKNNAAFLEQEKVRALLRDERARLQNLSRRITDLKARRKVSKDNFDRWEKSILDFNTENAQLIKDVEAEGKIVAVNKMYVKAYYSLLSRLEVYRNHLPVKHLEKLNSLTLELYNTINKHDRPFEKAASIELPATTDGTINICFMDSPEVKHDALHILSEGHLRCLGLAILLAKNIHDGCPVAIFDDVVNAIDDDHKGGVREVIFNHTFLGSKQIILTTHAEQFVKELEQHPTATEYGKLVRKFTFLPDNDRRLIRIMSNTIQNYLVKASQCCEKAEWSDALFNCRCALENITHRLWKLLSGRDFKTEFAVVIRTPNGKPDLMTIVTALNSFLKKVDKANEFVQVTEKYDYLLGLKSHSNVIWSYLNKGAHEEPDKSEFDQLIVKEIVQKLVELDSTVKSLKKTTATV
ncbi:MAG: AAA family ATPase [bacterium]